MKSRIFILIACLGCCAAFSYATSAPRPNMLYFYVDDMGWGSIGPNGQAERKAQGLPYVLTPNLDQLAVEGVNFTRGYGCHVCSPARSSQQTGFHQGHTFADRNDPDNAKKAMRSDDVTMGDALSEAGYVTGYWGKWGYGGSKDLANPVIQNVQTLPTAHGYQYVLAELHHVRAHTFFQPTLWSAPAAEGALGGLELKKNSMKPFMGNSKYPEAPSYHSDKRYPKTAYCDDSYAFAALEFVRTQGQNYNKTGQPFFGLFAAQIPHAPFDEISKLPKWDKPYRNQPWFAGLPDQAKEWAAMVTRIDAHFGNILAALKDPNNDGDGSDSIVDDTLVIFQSDNGGPGGKNNPAFDSNGGLSGTKGKIQEGGIRVPLVMRWPAKINSASKLKAGSETDMVVDVTDLLPTFCELAGSSVPVGLDGVSIAPTLTGDGLQRKRPFIIHEASNGKSIIRDKFKVVRGKKGESSLFNLEQDPAETTNLAAANPALTVELEELLLGERVDEPHGFANSYHRWIGKMGAKTSSPDNWSDYEYANAGKSYFTDAGAPQLSWTARISHTGKRLRLAFADQNFEVLGLEISGLSPQGNAGLRLNPKAEVHGRNEIRVGAYGRLDLNGGTASSLRWIDVVPTATIIGPGTIDGDLYTQGAVHANVADTALKVTGTSYLSGTLNVSMADTFKPVPGATVTLIEADSIQGTFDALDMDKGVQAAVSYTDQLVILTFK